jgi:cytochrome b
LRFNFALEGLRVQKIRVWDLPTRLFHWCLLLCVLGLFITSEMKASNALLWHSRLGYGVLILLLFRVLWGLVGGRWSRFSNFIYSPSSLLRYLRGKANPEHLVGHNPLGALSVFAMLAALLVQVGSGLISDNEIDFTGPLSHWVSSATALTATTFHKTGGKAFLILLVLLHVVAIGFYRFKKKERLVHAMLLGDKHIASSLTARASVDTLATRVFALILLCACAGFVYWLQA